MLRETEAVFTPGFRQSFEGPASLLSGLSRSASASIASSAPKKIPLGLFFGTPVSSFAPLQETRKKVSLSGHSFSVSPAPVSIRGVG